jgi:hypothetical protein
VSIIFLNENVNFIGILIGIDSIIYMQTDEEIEKGHVMHVRDILNATVKARALDAIWG